MNPTQFPYPLVDVGFSSLAPESISQDLQESNEIPKIKEEEKTDQTEYNRFWRLDSYQEIRHSHWGSADAYNY